MGNETTALLTLALLNLLGIGIVIVAVRIRRWRAPRPLPRLFERIDIETIERECAEQRRGPGE